MIAQDYITRAIARSYRNRGEVLAPQVPELLDALTLLFTQRYAQASGLNPAVFLKRAVLNWVADGWTIPADCDTMVLMRVNSGAQVFVVAIDNLDAEPTEAAVYRMGRRYLPAGNPVDPVNVPLVAFYTQIPAAFAAVDQAPGPEWPQQFDTMVVVDLAVWMATKDGRADDLQALAPEQGAWDAKYREWLQRESLGLVRQFAKQAIAPSVGLAKVAGT